MVDGPIKKSGPTALGSLIPGQADSIRHILLVEPVHSKFKSILFQLASAQPPPTAPPPQGTRPLQPLSPSSLRAFSVSGRRLKSLKQPSAPTPLPPPNASHHQHQGLEQQRDLQHQHGLHEPLQQQRISLSSAGNRASSRLSMNGPMHWGKLDITIK